MTRRQVPVATITVPDPLRVRETSELSELRDVFDHHRLCRVSLGGRAEGMVLRAS